MATTAEISTRLQEAKRRGLEVQEHIEALQLYSRYAGNIFRVAGNCLDPKYHTSARSGKPIQSMIDHADFLLTQGLALVESLEKDVAPAARRSRAARGRVPGTKRPKPPKGIRPSG